MRTLTVAAIQTSPITCDVDASWKRFADQVRRAQHDKETVPVLL